MSLKFQSSRYHIFCITCLHGHFLHFSASIVYHLFFVSSQKTFLKIFLSLVSSFSIYISMFITRYSETQSWQPCCSILCLICISLVCCIAFCITLHTGSIPVLLIIVTIVVSYLWNRSWFTIRYSDNFDKSYCDNLI